MPEQPTALPQPPVQQPPLVNAPSGPVAPLTQADLPEQDLVDAGPPAPPEPGRLIAVKPQPRPTEVRGPGIPPLDPRTAPKLTSGDPADHFDSVFQGAELAKFENLMDLIGEQLPRSEIERWVAYVPPETDYSLTGLIGTFSLKDKPPEGLIRPGDAPASAIWGPKYKSETDEEALARLKRIAQAKAYYTRQALYTRMGSAFLTFGLADATPPLERLYGKAEQLNPDLGKSLIGLQTEHPLVGKLAPSDISTLTGFFIPGSPSGKLFHRLMREFQVAATPAARSARQAFRARFGEKVLDADPKMFKSLDRMVEQANGVVSTKGYIHLPKGIDPALKDAIMQEAKRLSNVARDLTGIRRRAFRVISTEGGPIGPAQRLAGHTGAMTSFSGLHTGVAAATHPDQAGEILRTLPESMAHGAATGAGLFFPLGELAGLATRGRQGMGYDVVPRWENPRRPLGGAVDSEGRYLSVEGNVVDKNGRITTLDPQKFAHELRPVDPAPTFGEALQRVDQSAVDQISDLNHADPARRLLARAQHEQGTGEISVGSLVARDPAGLTLDDPTEVPIVQRNGRLYGLKDVDGQLQAIDITDSLAPLNIPAEARYTFAEDPTSPIRYTLKEEPGKPEELVVDASATAGRDVHRLMLRLLQDPAAEVDVDPMTIWATVNQAPPATEARRSGYAKQVKKVEAQLEEAFANSREVAKQLAGSDATDWQVEDVHTKLISRLQLQRLALREAARALNMPLRIPSAPAVQAAPSDEKRQAPAPYTQKTASDIDAPMEGPDVRSGVRVLDQGPSSTSLGPEPSRKFLRNVGLYQTPADKVNTPVLGREPLPTTAAIRRFVEELPDDILEGLGINLVDIIPEQAPEVPGLHITVRENGKALYTQILLRAALVQDAAEKGEPVVAAASSVVAHELGHQIFEKVPAELKAAIIEEFHHQRQIAFEADATAQALYRFKDPFEYFAEMARIDVAKRFNAQLDRIKSPRVRRFVIALRDLFRRYFAMLQDLGDRLGVYKPTTRKPASQVAMDYATGKISRNQTRRLANSINEQTGQLGRPPGEVAPTAQPAARHLLEMAEPWGSKMSALHDAIQPLSSRMLELMLEAEELPPDSPRHAEIKAERAKLEQQARELTTEMFKVQEEWEKAGSPAGQDPSLRAAPPEKPSRRRRQPPTREEAVARIGGSLTKAHADLLTPAERIQHYHLRLANAVDKAALTTDADGQPKFGGLLKHLKNLRVQRDPNGVITKPSYFAGWKPTDAEFAELTKAHKARQAQLNHIIKGLKRAQRLASSNSSPQRNKAGGRTTPTRVTNAPVTPLTTEELVNVANMVLTNQTLREAMTPDQLAGLMHEVTPRRAAERLAKSVAEASKAPLPEPDREAVMDFWDLMQDHQATWLAQGRDTAVQLDQAFRKQGLQGIISRPWRWAVDHTMAALHWLADGELKLSRPDEVLGSRGELTNAPDAIAHMRSGGLEKSVWGLLYGDEASGAQGMKQFLSRTSDNFAPIFALERADPEFASQLLKAVTQAWPEDLPAMQKTYRMDATLARALGLPVNEKGFKLADAVRAYRQFFDQTMTRVADSRKQRATYTATRLHTVAQGVRGRLTQELLDNLGITAASLPAGFTASEPKFIQWIANEKNWKDLIKLAKGEAAQKRLRNKLRGLRRSYELYRQQREEYDLWDLAQKVLKGEVDWDTALAKRPDLPIRRDYAPVMNMANLLKDDLKLEFEDPYSVYQYLDDKVYNSFLQARKADELPDLYLFEMMGLYVPTMARSIYLEPALIKAMPKVVELPVRHQLYARKWIEALKGKVDPYQGALQLGLADVLARSEKQKGKGKGPAIPAKVKARRQDAYDKFARPFLTLSFMGTVRPSSLGVVNLLEQLWVPGMMAAHGEGGLVRGLPSQLGRSAAGIGRWAGATVWGGPRDLAKEGTLSIRRAIANQLGNVPPEHSPEYYAGAFRALGDQGQYEFYNMFRSALGTVPDPNKLARTAWQIQFHFQTGVDMWERMSGWNTWYNDAMYYAGKSIEIRKDSMGRHYLYDRYTETADSQRFPTRAAAEQAKQAKATKEARWYAKYMVDLVYSDYSTVGQSPYTRGGLAPWFMQLKRFGLNKLDLMSSAANRALQAREGGLRSAEFGWLPPRLRDITKAALQATARTPLDPNPPGEMLRQDVGRAVGTRPSEVSIPASAPPEFTRAEQEAYAQMMSGVEYFKGARASNQAINAARRQLLGFTATGYATMKLAPLLGINSLYSLPWFQAATPVLSLMTDLWDMVPATAMQAAGGKVDQYQRRNMERTKQQLTTLLMPGGAFVRDWQNEQIAKLLTLDLPPEVLERKIREIKPAPWEDPKFLLGGGLYRALDLDKLLYGDVTAPLKRLYTVPERRPQPPKSLEQLLQERAQ